MSAPIAFQHAPLNSVIAHRGASGHAPENTLSAITLAIELGAKCVEIDVSISADQIAFVHHDDTLERCTTGAGRLADHTASALEQLYAGKNWPGFASEPLPKLSQVLELLVENEVGLNLEIKPVRGLEAATVIAIATEIDQIWIDRLPLVLSSFNSQALLEAKKHIPHVPRGYLVEGIPQQWQQSITRFACSNLHCDGHQLTENEASMLLESGLGLYCYTVNEPAKVKELYGMGVHGIFTDFPDRILAHQQP